MDKNDKNGFMNIPELQQEKNILGRWSSFFIERYRIVFLIIGAIMIWGISAYMELPRELQPEVVLPFGHVYTSYVGAAPEEIENLITDKIEKKLDELEDVKSISSNSGYGYSSVFVEFEQDVDIDEKVDEMRAKISAIQSELPKDAEIPVVSNFETNNSAIMIINITGDYDFVTLKNIAENIQDEIEKMKEVSEVQIIGGLEREIKVIVDPQKLFTYHITLGQIKNAIDHSNVNFPGGNIDLNHINYNIRTIGELEYAEELEDVVISYRGNSPLFLKDIATIEDGYADRESYSRLSSGLGTDHATLKDSVAIAVKKKKWADIIKTSNKIHELLDNGRGSIYPNELQIEISGDTAEYVEDELGAVLDNSKSGLFLVVIVLFLFIGFRESLIVSFVIPISIFIAMGLMHITDNTLNTITLFSLILAIGMLVDNAIVIMENVVRLREQGLTANLAAEAGTNQIVPAVAASTLTTIAAFFPIALTPGIMGKFIRPIPITVIFALGASFFVAITITPALCAIVMKRRKKAKTKKHPHFELGNKILSIVSVFVLSMYAFKEKDTGALEFGTLSIIFAVIFTSMMIMRQFYSKKNGKDHFIIKTYGNIIYDIIRSKKKKTIVIGVTLVAFLMSVALIPLGLLKVQMFASTDYARLYINIETPKGTVLEDTSRIAEEVEKRLFDYPEIETFVSNVGITGADSFDAFGVGSGGTPNMARIIIDLCDEENRERSSMEIAALLREDIQDIPGAKIEVEELKDGPPSEKPIIINISGENLEQLKDVANDYYNILKEIPNVRDVENSIEEGAPELQIKVNKKKAALFGLNDMTVALEIRNSVHGLKATTFRDNQEEIDVMIQTNKEKLDTIEDLNKIYFISPTGQRVLFSQVAEVVDTKGVSSIRHEDLKRQVNVSSNITSGSNALEIIKEFQNRVKDNSMPKGIDVTYGGEMEDIQETFTDMLKNMIIAAILVFLILAVQFNSLSQPFIILIAVPMSMIGVMPGLFITGNDFGFVSFVGVVSLVGIAVNDAIVLIDYINYLRKNGYELKEAIKETGMTRFMPVMATTITTAGGILPITLKQPFFAPMGYALIFGLSMATILTLVIVPVIYSILEGLKLKRQDKKRMRFEKGGLENEEDLDLSVIN